MIQVDIFRKNTYDIVIIDTNTYLHSSVFHFILYFLKTHISQDILKHWPTNESTIETCLEYKGIAIPFESILKNRKKTKEEFQTIVLEALDNALS